MARYTRTLLALPAVSLAVALAGCSGNASISHLSKSVKGLVKAPGQVFHHTAGAQPAGLTAHDTTIQAQSGANVWIGTISQPAADGTTTFTPIAGPIVSDANGNVTFDGSTITPGPNVVMVASGASTPPTTLPDTTGTYEVCPVTAFSDKETLTVDPFSTEAQYVLDTNCGKNGVPIANVPATDADGFVKVCETDSATVTGGDIVSDENGEKTAIDGDTTAKTDLDVTITDTMDNTAPATGSLTTPAFTVSADANGNAFNGTASAFTATKAFTDSCESNVYVNGFMPANPAAGGNDRAISIAIPSTSGTLAAGTYTATIVYTESTPAGASGTTSDSVQAVWTGTATVTVTTGTSTAFNVSASNVMLTPNVAADTPNNPAGNITISSISASV